MDSRSFFWFIRYWTIAVLLASTNNLRHCHSIRQELSGIRGSEYSFETRWNTANLFARINEGTERDLCIHYTRIRPEIIHERSGNKKTRRAERLGVARVDEIIPRCIVNVAPRSDGALSSVAWFRDRREYVDAAAGFIVRIFIGLGSELQWILMWFFLYTLRIERRMVYRVLKMFYAVHLRVMVLQGVIYWWIVGDWLNWLKTRFGM